MEVKPNSHLKKVLKSYQLSAANTMSGPSTVMSRLDNSSNSMISSNNQFRHSKPYESSHAAENFNSHHHQNSIKQKLLHKTNPVFSRTSQQISQSTYNSSEISMRKEIELRRNGSVERTKASGIRMCSNLVSGQFKSKDKSGRVSSKTVLHLGNSSNGTSSNNNSYSFQPPPIISTADQCRPIKKETVLEGERISCFLIGGEKRLCIPQIFTSVLRGFSPANINQILDELQIFVSISTNEQLEVLKLSGAIPPSTPLCGLITKTDAERLVNLSLHKNPPKKAVSVFSAVNHPQDPKRPQAHSHFRVYHECFGVGKGVVLPDLYENQNSLCIECIDCHGLFSPQHFVRHSHSDSSESPEYFGQENRTCHWGFDSSKWRNYLLVAEDQENLEKLNKMLNEFKGKFDRKRKESGESLEESRPDEHLIIKKKRYGSGGTAPDELNSGSNIDKVKKLSQLVVTPFNISPTSLSILPTKKRLPYIQNQFSTDNDLNNGANYELESIMELVKVGMGKDKETADIVNGYIVKLSKRISNLERICINQDNDLNGKVPTAPKTELQVKVNSMELELHSLKKQLLRRHCEEH